MKIENMALRCLSCGGEYMHHMHAELFYRREDAPSKVVTVSGDGVVEFDANVTDNPSARRGAVVVALACEGCLAVMELCVIQHKGQSLLTFREAQ